MKTVNLARQQNVWFFFFEDYFIFICLKILKLLGLNENFFCGGRMEF